jgi:CheY-like chemotaxis protein
MEIDLPLAGTRVFIVEDEALILDTLQDMLEGLGCQVVESALRVDEALSKLVGLDFDVAVLDVNVAGTRIDPVADLLARRGMPFLFASGYGRGSLPAAHRERVLLTKPYRTADLQAALDSVLPQ